MKKIHLGLALAIFFTSAAYSEPLQLKYFQTDQRYNYRIALLRLAMENTVKSDGPYVLAPNQDKLSPIRALYYLESGETINVVFMPSNQEMESRFLSVKVPILAGLLGYRVSLIRKENLEAFRAIESLDQLTKKFTAGFGSQWADMEILKANDIPVVGSVRYDSLFKMLSGERFDYFPRGINEVWSEQNHHPDLVVDPYIALYYPYPVYFYVNKKDLLLADRIRRGLEKAINNGTFKELFLKYHAELIQKANLNNRKLFKLKNPTLAEGTPDPDTRWWLDQK